MVVVIQKPIEGATATYVGVYRPHWEIAHIAVRVPRGRVSIRRLNFPVFFALAVLAGFVMNRVNLIEASVVVGLFAIVEFSLWMLPNEERWAPQFPAGSDVGHDETGGPIEFEGVVSAPGSYGHKGMMRRQVEIVRVLRYKNRQVGLGKK